MSLLIAIVLTDRAAIAESKPSLDRQELHIQQPHERKDQVHIQVERSRRCSSALLRRRCIR
jgi:hypothetical protein